MKKTAIILILLLNASLAFADNSKKIKQLEDERQRLAVSFEKKQKEMVQKSGTELPEVPTYMG